MEQSCKLVIQVPIKAGGELFHQFVSTKPHNFVNASPDQVHTCQVHEGDDGSVGCVMEWQYTIDGKKHMAKNVVEKLDMQNKMITYKWLEGDMLDLYKHLSVSIHVETKQGTDFVTWILEYELLKPDNPHPLSLIKFYIDLTAEIESHLSST